MRTRKMGSNAAGRAHPADTYPRDPTCTCRVLPNVLWMAPSAAPDSFINTAMTSAPGVPRRPQFLVSSISRRPT